LLAGKWMDDANLAPFLPDDALLWWDPFDEAQASKDPEPELFTADQYEKSRVTDPALNTTMTIASTSTVTGQPPNNDDYYFDSYSRLDIHEEMICDRARTDAYRDALLKGANGLVVVDVGCGTGILSMFSAKAGAKHVYAIEASGMAALASKLVEANGFASRVTVLKGRAEQLVDTRSDIQADIIVSEWMGYALFYESMLESVLCVRDAWLKPGGRMYPSQANLYLEAVQDKGYRVGFWDDVYGFDFSLLKPLRVANAGNDYMHLETFWKTNINPFFSHNMKKQT